MSIYFEDDLFGGVDYSYGENQEDSDFFKCLYPVELMEMQMCIEAKCNELEYPGSMIYDKYPDRVRLEKLSRDMCKGREDFDDKLMQVMLVNEIFRRRMRRRS